MLTIILGMLIFAVVHTLTADQRSKQRIQQRIGERTYYAFYRLLYNALSLLLLLPVWLAMRSDQTILWQIEHPAGQAVWFIVQAIGSIGLLISLIQIDLLRFAGLKQVWVYMRGGHLPLATEPLVTNGLYAISRHPLYFFSLLAIWFVPVMSSSYFAFCLAATAYFMLGSRLEEGRLLAAYGQEYAVYQQRVPWMLPFAKILR